MRSRRARPAAWGMRLHYFNDEDLAELLGDADGARREVAGDQFFRRGGIGPWRSRDEVSDFVCAKCLRALDGCELWCPDGLRQRVLFIALAEGDHVVCVQLAGGRA